MFWTNMSRIILNTYPNVFLFVGPKHGLFWARYRPSAAVADCRRIVIMSQLSTHQIMAKRADPNRVLGGIMFWTNMSRIILHTYLNMFLFVDPKHGLFWARYRPSAAADGS